mmetsp:Transcript_13702/g.18812  ORF Transcript_13702/g.18812 Transcript_13702/m.18812 type:complete len:222 (-) Transcript_13702:1011-1676(-)
MHAALEAKDSLGLPPSSISSSSSTSSFSLERPRCCLLSEIATSPPVFFHGRYSTGRPCFLDNLMMDTGPVSSSGCSESTSPGTAPLFLRLPLQPSLMSPGWLSKLEYVDTKVSTSHFSSSSRTSSSIRTFSLCFFPAASSAAMILPNSWVFSSAAVAISCSSFVRCSVLAAFLPMGMYCSSSSVTAAFSSRNLSSTLWYWPSSLLPLTSWSSSKSPMSSLS